MPKYIDRSLKHFKGNITDNFIKVLPFKSKSKWQSPRTAMENLECIMFEDLFNISSLRIFF